jgi:hypothetical protein
MGDACISAVKDAYADGDLRDDELATVYSLDGACSAIIVGPGEVGDACSSDRDCDASRGLVCARKSSQDEGSCQEALLVGPGRDCAAERKVCGTGFYCDGEHCVEAKARGASCSFHGECDPGGFCNGEGICEAGRRVSEECSADLECSSGICHDFEDTQVCTDRIVLTRTDPACDDLR